MKQYNRDDVIKKLGEIDIGDSVTVTCRYLNTSGSITVSHPEMIRDYSGSKLEEVADKLIERALSILNEIREEELLLEDVSLEVVKLNLFREDYRYGKTKEIRW